MVLKTESHIQFHITIIFLANVNLIKFTETIFSNELVFRCKTHLNCVTNCNAVCTASCIMKEKCEFKYILDHKKWSGQ